MGSYKVSTIETYPQVIGLIESFGFQDWKGRVLGTFRKFAECEKKYNVQW